MLFTAEGGMILGPIAWVLGKILNLIYDLLANFGPVNLGVCIIIFTLVVKLILLPLTIKQQKSSKINSYIQPEIKEIQKKYKNRKDQDSMVKQNEEIQAVYEKYGTKMTAGCLTSFIQLPIILGLYRVIQNIPAYVKDIKSMYSPIATSALDVENIKQVLIDFVDENKISAANTAIKAINKADALTANNIIDILDKFTRTNWDAFEKLMEKNPAVIDAITGNLDKIESINSFILGINLAENPGWKISWALLIPIASGLFQFLSSKTMSNPSTGNDGADPSANIMRTMTYTMPLFSAFICISMPAGVGLYWAISSLFAFVIQLTINFYYDHIDMEKVIAKNVAKAAKKKKSGKKSLMDKLMETAKGSAANNQSTQSKSVSSKIPNTNLRNYNAYYDDQDNGEEEVKEKANYKSGSLGSKANIMMNYEDKNNKGGNK